jgi:hypothetical protein
MRRFRPKYASAFHSDATVAAVSEWVRAIRFVSGCAGRREQLIHADGSASCLWMTVAVFVVDDDSPARQEMAEVERR